MLELMPLPPAGRQSCLHWGRSQAGPQLCHAMVIRTALLCLQAAQGGDSTSVETLPRPLLEGLGEAGTPLPLLRSSALRSEVEVYFSRRGEGIVVSCCFMLDKASRGPPNSVHTALTVPQERGRARGSGSALGCAVRGAQHCFWGTAIPSQTLLPILVTPKLEPFLMKGWLGRSSLGLPWPSILPASPLL